MSFNLPKPRTKHGTKAGVAALLALALVGVVALVLIPKEADASYIYLGPNVGTEGAADDLLNSSVVLREAVEGLSREWNIDLALASVRWLDQSEERSALALIGNGALCLVEETVTGVNATCDTDDNAADRGLYLARYVRESERSDRITEVLVLAVSPNWATHLSGSGEGLRAVEAGYHSLRLTGDDVSAVDRVGWSAPSVGRSVTLGLELPSTVPIDDEG